MSDCSEAVRNMLMEAVRVLGAEHPPCFVINMIRLSKDDRAFVAEFIKQHGTGATYNIGNMIVFEKDECYFYFKMMERWT